MVCRLQAVMTVMMIQQQVFDASRYCNKRNNPTICYRDNDEDGFGDITATGDISAGTDCDDGLLNGPTRYPELKNYAMA